MAREMKYSGFAWIGDIPLDWEVRKVKHYYKTQTGFTPDTKNENYYDEISGFDWVNISDISNGQTIRETKKKVSQEYIDLYAPNIIPENSLLYSFKLSVGQTAFAGKPLYSNEAIASFLPDKSVCLRYLRYSSVFIIENAQTNIYNAKILNQDLIKNAYIVFPPLDEQKLIADFLDEKCAAIDSAVEKTRESIEEYKKLKQDTTEISSHFQNTEFSSIRGSGDFHTKKETCIGRRSPFYILQDILVLSSRGYNKDTAPREPYVPGRLCRYGFPPAFQFHTAKRPLLFPSGSGFFHVEFPQQPPAIPGVHPDEGLLQPFHSQDVPPASGYPPQHNIPNLPRHHKRNGYRNSYRCSRSRRLP